MFESRKKDSYMVCFSCFKWFSVDSALGNIKYQHITKKNLGISLCVKKDRENDTGQMEHLFLMNEKHLSPSIAHSFCAKSN